MCDQHLCDRSTHSTWEGSASRGGQWGLPQGDAAPPSSPQGGSGAWRPLAAVNGRREMAAAEGRRRGAGSWGEEKPCRRLRRPREGCHSPATRLGYPWAHEAARRHRVVVSGTGTALAVSVAGGMAVGSRGCLRVSRPDGPLSKIWKSPQMHKSEQLHQTYKTRLLPSQTRLFYKMEKKIAFSLQCR